MIRGPSWRGDVPESLTETDDFGPGVVFRGLVDESVNVFTCVEVDVVYVESIGIWLCELGAEFDRDTENLICGFE